MNAPPDHITIPQALLRGWRRRCPRCEGGDLFESFFRLRGTCPDCGLVTRGEEGSLTGQMYLSAAVTQVVAAALMVAVFLLTDWGLVTAMAVLLPTVIFLCYWTLPRFMSTWVAVEFLTDRSNQRS